MVLALDSGSLLGIVDCACSSSKMVGGGGSAMLVDGSGSSSTISMSCNPIYPAFAAAKSSIARLSKSAVSSSKNKEASSSFTVQSL